MKNYDTKKKKKKKDDDDAGLSIFPRYCFNDSGFKNDAIAPLTHLWSSITTVPINSVHPKSSEKTAYADLKGCCYH